MTKIRIAVLLMIDIALFFIPDLMHNVMVQPMAKFVSMNNNPVITGLLLFSSILIFRLIISVFQWRDDVAIRNYDDHVRTITESVPDKDKQKVNALIKLNNLKKAKTYRFELALIQLPFILTFYQVAKEVHGTLFGINLNTQIAWLGFVIGFGYWIKYKYITRNMSHINRWTTPAIMFFVSTVANFSIQMYLLVSLISSMLVEYIPRDDGFKQSKFVSDLPDEIETEKKSGVLAMLSIMDKKQLRLFGATIRNTLTFYYLFEIAISIGGSIYSGSPIPQIIFILTIIVADLILPDKKYGWFR